jgi:outer membrane protein TolC
MLQKGTILIAVLVGWPLHSNAEQLDLNKAIEIARANSHVIMAAKERQESAKQQKLEAYGYLAPKIDLMEIATRTEQPGEVFGLNMNRREDIVGQMGQAFGMNADDTGYLFSTGMNNDVMVNPDPMNTYITRIQAEMPIFTGGMIWSRIKQAGLMADAEELQTNRDTKQVDFDVAKAWTDLAKAREFLELINRARSTTLAHVKIARDYAEAGFLVSSDLLRAEVYLAEMEEFVARAINGTKLAEAALNFNLGITQTTSHELGEIPPRPSTAGGLDSWIKKAVSTRQDLAGAKLKARAGELEKLVAASAFLPTVGVQGRYDFYDDKIFGNDEGSYSVSGVIKFNIFSGGSDRARFAKARHNGRAWNQDLERFEEAVRLQVQQAYGDYEASLLRNAAAVQAQDAGRENLRVVEERFKQGIAKMIDLLDAETALRELEVRELVSRYDTYLSAYRLRNATGLSIVE